MKKILYFYPHKFAKLTDGIHTRIVTILEYFKSRGFLVDMVNFENPQIQGSYLIDNDLVDNLYLVADNPFNEKQAGQVSKFSDMLAQKMNSVQHRIAPERFNRKQAEKEKRLPNLMTQSLTNKISDLSNKNQYSAVLITYSYWADIIKVFSDKSPRVKKVMDPTDFLALQQFYNNSSLSFRQIGNMFGDELERVSEFDEVIHISNDELLLFANFTPHVKHTFIPQFFQRSFFADRSQPKKYDVLLIASGNPYNLEGVNWFFNEVYPLLKPTIRIAIAGNIGSKIPFAVENVSKLGFVDDVRELYQASLCTICPIKRGSGMKIKVIESLSFGLPVVSTSKGVDGFINKDLQSGVLVTDIPPEFAEFINRLADDLAFFENQSAGAMALFDRIFSKEVNFTKLDEIFLKP